MEKILDLISGKMADAFESAGFDRSYGRVTVSNRPDLCEYQCNGALAAAKVYHKAPIQIAQAVAAQLHHEDFASVAAVAPGFINLRVSGAFLQSYLASMRRESAFGVEKEPVPKTIVVDYGGPNVAKPLHIGHLRSAIIGESIKRIGRFMGHTMIGDVHLGDWGLQMGLIITELKQRKPDLAYFEEGYDGEYPDEAPFTISELEEIYPTASAKSKEDAFYKEAAMQATYELQHGRRGYQALLSHILNVSVSDLKRNYENLNVSFELWKGESLYNTTDLATIVWRMEEYCPDEIIYVVDKRQELYFTQVFRCARKTRLAGEGTKFRFLGFGTMNGPDGKPFKTRDGGVMRLESLVEEINEEMYRKIAENQTMGEDEARKTAKVVALSAIKYGDLSNQASKDYMFDIDRFTSFEGNTGPYILYTVVRIKSILAKYQALGEDVPDAGILPARSESEKELMLEVSRFQGAVEAAYAESAPHKVCAYIYGLANALNRFYHGTKILAEEDKRTRAGYICLLTLTKDILETCIDLLGFHAPERM